MVLLYFEAKLQSTLSAYTITKQMCYHAIDAILIEYAAAHAKRHGCVGGTDNVFMHIKKRTETSLHKKKEI